MKIVFTGVTGFQNRGVQALVIPAIEQLQKRFPDAQIQVFSDFPKFDQFWLDPYQVRATTSYRVPMIRLRNSRFQKYRLQLSRWYEPLTPQPYKAFQDNLRDTSLVIASGGDIFSSDYGLTSLAANLLPLELSIKAGIPVVFLAHSIGPFKTQSEVDTWLKVARQSSLITVREQFSYDYLRSLGLDENLVKLTADTAFLLKPQADSQNLLQSVGIDPEQPVVAIAPSQSITSYAGLDAYERHLDVWQAVIQLILQDLKAQVLIIPHVQYEGQNKDDRLIAHTLLRRFDYHPQIHLAALDASASEFKGLISHCDLVIAERMHAAIAGLSSRICTVAVGYSVKAKGIMTDLLGTDFVQDFALLSIEQFLDKTLACQSILKAWHQRQEISAHLTKKIPVVESLSTNNYDLITSLFD